MHDDPSDLKQMKSMIMTAFGGQVIGSSCLAMSASTVPLVWANKPCHKRKTSIYIDTYIYLSLMYKYVVRKYKNCHITTAFGAKNMGKTTASDICVNTVGQQASVIRTSQMPK